MKSHRKYPAIDSFGILPKWKYLHCNLTMWFSPSEIMRFYSAIIQLFLCISSLFGWECLQDLQSGFVLGTHCLIILFHIYYLSLLSFETDIEKSTILTSVILLFFNFKYILYIYRKTCNLIYIKWCKLVFSYKYQTI